MSEDRPDVLSLVQVLGRRSETWLYNQLVAPRDHRVHVFTSQHVNRAEYPFARVTACRTMWSPLYDRARRALRKGPADWMNWLGPYTELLHKTIASQRFGVIQAHFGWTGFYALDCAYRERRPLVVWLYGSDVFQDGPCRNEFLPQLFRSANVFFACTSRALREEIASLGGDVRRIRVVYPGLDLSKHPPVTKRASSGALNIVSVGRMIPFKDPEGLVKIARLLDSAGLDFTWEIVGAGPLLANVRRAVDELGLTGRMRLHGEVPNTAVRALLAAADVMVHAGVVAPDGSRESFGVVLVEAGATGLPIVASDVGGIPEIVVHGETGLTARPGDAAAMARAILQLAGDPDYRAQLGASARTHVETNFDIRRLAGELDAYYADLLRSAP